MVKINDVEITEFLESFEVSISDLDAETTTRTADGTLNRDRIAVKQKIDLSFAPLLWEDMSRILKATEDIFFEIYYPNPESGEYETKTVYVGDRKAAVMMKKEEQIMWKGLKFSLIER